MGLYMGIGIYPLIFGTIWKSNTILLFQEEQFIAIPRIAKYCISKKSNILLFQVIESNRLTIYSLLNIFKYQGNKNAYSYQDIYGQ